MTDSSSVGNPDGAALPADHPLGPAAPIPPLEKESARLRGADTAREEEGTEDRTGTTVGGQRVSSGQDDGGAPGADGGTGKSDGGTRDRREDVLEPSAGTADHGAASIRDEQGTSSAGTVPAAFNGEGSPEDPDENRHPEDAAAEPDTWDSGGARA